MGGVTIYIYIYMSIYLINVRMYAPYTYTRTHTHTLARSHTHTLSLSRSLLCSVICTLAHVHICRPPQSDTEGVHYAHKYTDYAISGLYGLRKRLH